MREILCEGQFRVTKLKKVSWLIMAGLLVLFFSDCNRQDRIEQAFRQYQTRAIVRDSKGNRFRVEDYRLAFSDDGGGTWIGVSTIPSMGYAAWGYSLACGDDDVFYFAQVGVGRGKKAIYVSRSSDGGRTWIGTVVANDEIWAQRTDPKLACKGENVFVVWLERGGRGAAGLARPSGIYFSRSFDGGRTWDEDTWLREGEDGSITVAEDGTIYLAYVGSERLNIIYLSYSDDNGGNWHSETTGERLMIIEEPYVIPAGPTIYLFCQAVLPSLSNVDIGAKIDYQTYYLTSKDRGKSWSNMVELKEEGGD